jgi:hypothetical protein
MASVHKECGADIVWAKRDDDSGRWLPPMEYVGEVYLLEGKGDAKVGTQKHAYRIHQCDPDRIIEWQDYQHRLAEAKGETFTPYEAAREKINEETWAQALRVDCPRCERPAGEKCISLSRHLIITGEIQECRNPHPARMNAFEEWLYDRKNADGEEV